MHQWSRRNAEIARTIAWLVVHTALSLVATVIWATQGQFDALAVERLLAPEILVLGGILVSLGAVRAAWDALQIYRRHSGAVRLRGMIKSNPIALLTATIEAIPDGMLILDRDQQVLAYNRNFLDLWNVPGRRVAGQDGARVLARIVTQVEDPDGYTASVEALLASPEEECFDLIRFEDGRVFERWSQPQRVEGDAAGRVFGFRDATERYRAESALLWLNDDLESRLRKRATELQDALERLGHESTHRKSAEEEVRRLNQILLDPGSRDAQGIIASRDRQLIESARDIIFTIDLHGRITSINAAGASMTGYQIGELLGQDLAQLVTTEYRDRVREMMSRAVAGDPLVAERFELIGKTGAIVPVEINSWLQVESGGAIGVQGIARDVSKRQRLEEQLQQAQKMEAVGKLAGGVAHDFNNLLTVIRGFGELLGNAPGLPAEAKEYVQQIRLASENAAALTGQLLAFGRRQRLEPRIIDPTGIVRELEPMIRRLIPENIHLRILTAPDAGYIRADPSQLQQVILNLAVNARDAMPNGGTLAISIGPYLMMGNGPSVRITVSDSGFGMDAATRARIFEPFFTTKEMGKGTGLGLATVYGIVEQSGGQIDVASAVGEGTMFTITFPCVAQAAPIRQQVNEEVLQRGHGTILLVEDESGVRSFAKAALTTAGYTVIEAVNGADALHVASRHPEPLAAVVTDVIMPELGGPELARRLRRQRTGLKVLFISGYTENNLQPSDLRTPGTAFLSKPFSPRKLLEAVAELVRPASEDQTGEDSAQSAA